MSVRLGVKVEHWTQLLGYHPGQQILLTLYAVSRHHGGYCLETDFQFVFGGFQGRVVHFLGDIGRGGFNFGFGGRVKGSSAAISESTRKLL